MSTTPLVYLPLTPESDLPAFRAFFAAISVEHWRRSCALDHLGLARGETGLSRSASTLARAFTPLIEPLGDSGGHSAALYMSVPRGACIAFEVNDGHDPRYQQPDARARVLAALDDLIAGTVPPIPSTS